MDLTSMQEIRSIAKQFGFHFSKGLGQNFLLDSSVLDDIVQASAPEEGVLEIGPGFGVLTRALAKASQKVVSVEVDRSLEPVLEYTLGEFDNTKVVFCDILKTDIGALLKEEFGDREISVAANLPYYITTPIITRLIESRLPFKNIVVMVQKEVAERLCAEAGSKDYGAISVMCQYYTSPEIVTYVPAQSFYPPPKVDSAVVKFTVLEEPRVLVQNEKLLFQVVKAAFAQRRKTLLNCLSSGLHLDKPTVTAILEQAEIDPGIRGERLGLSDFARIADILSQKNI